MRMRVTILISMAMILLFCIGQSNDVLARKKKPLKVLIKKEDVNLKDRIISFKLSRPAEMAEIKVFNLDGEILAKKIETYSSSKANDSLSISWPTILEDSENFRIELKVTDVNEFWVAWEIIRFYGNIPHEEVVFESGKDEIRKEEAPKLDEVIPKILEMLEKFKKFGGDMDYGLYVAGYTDTVGNKNDNRALSLRRAKSIAHYFLNNGLKKKNISISVRGFGEEVLSVTTDDSVSEERNRRADYIVSNFPPEMPGPGSWIRIK